MDDTDFVFVNKPLSKKEDREFSDFLKSHKKKKADKAIEKEKVLHDK